MDKEVVDKIFREAHKKYLEILESEEGRRKFDAYKGMNIAEAIGTVYAQAMIDSADFIESVIIKLFNSEEFKKELFKEMLAQSKEEKSKTGKNPFEI